MQVLFSLVALVLSFFLIAFGLLFCLAPFARERLAYLIAEPHFCIWLGVAMAGLGCILIAIFSRFSKRRYYVVKMGGAHVLKVQDAVIAAAAEKSIGHPCQAIVRRKGMIEFLIDLPYLSMEEREAKFKQIESDLATTLAAELGYEQEFLLNVRLQDP